MKKPIFIYLLFTICFACGNKDNIDYNYEAACTGVGSTGTYLVKVFSYGSSVKKAKGKAKINAVHAILFKGISGGELCQPQKQICNVSFNEKKAWFTNFFESGDYLQYVSYSNDGYVDANDSVKISGGKYKVGVNVTVMVDALRKRMEKEGFARSLNQGF